MDQIIFSDQQDFQGKFNFVIHIILAAHFRYIDTTEKNY